MDPVAVFAYRDREVGRGRIKDGHNSAKTALVGVATPVETTGAAQREVLLLDIEMRPTIRGEP